MVIFICFEITHLAQLVADQLGYAIDGRVDGLIIFVVFSDDQYGQGKTGHEQRNGRDQGKCNGGR